MSDTELGNPGGKKKKKERSRDVSLIYDEHVSLFQQPFHACLLKDKLAPHSLMSMDLILIQMLIIRNVAIPPRLEIRTFIM